MPPCVCGCVRMGVCVCVMSGGGTHWGAEACLRSRREGGKARKLKHIYLSSSSSLLLLFPELSHAQTDYYYYYRGGRGGGGGGGEEEEGGEKKSSIFFLSLFVFFPHHDVVSLDLHLLIGQLLTLQFEAASICMRGRRRRKERKLFLQVFLGGGGGRGGIKVSLSLSSCLILCRELYYSPGQ